MIASAHASGMFVASLRVVPASTPNQIPCWQLAYQNLYCIFRHFRMDRAHRLKCQRNAPNVIATNGKSMSGAKTILFIYSSVDLRNSSNPH
jgi:hypothetical protein